jgi:hypothetical protein
MDYYTSLLSQIRYDLPTVVIGLQTFTLKIEGEMDFTLASCVQEEPKELGEREPSAAQVYQADRVFNWPAVLHYQQPPLGSVMVDKQSVYWTIIRISRIELTQTFRCHCRNLSILPSEANTATILKAQFVKGRANEAKAIYRGIISGVIGGNTQDQVPCRFQLVAEDAMIRFNSEWTKQSYRCILSKTMPIDFASSEYRILDSNGNRYRILQFFQEQRIDILPVAICVRIIEGAEYHGSYPLPMPPFPGP